MEAKEKLPGENLENFLQLLREEGIFSELKHRYIWEIGEALDKLKFSGWNSSNQQTYEGEVQEVIT
jgi:hypothetical protein